MMVILLEILIIFYYFYLINFLLINYKSYCNLPPVIFNFRYMDGGYWRMRTKRKIWNLYRDIINIMEIARIPLLGNVVRIQDSRVPEATMDGLRDGRRRRGKSRAWWQDDVRKDLRRI